MLDLAVTTIITTQLPQIPQPGINLINCYKYSHESLGCKEYEYSISIYLKKSHAGLYTVFQLFDKLVFPHIRVKYFTCIPAQMMEAVVWFHKSWCHLW